MAFWAYIQRTGVLYRPDGTLAGTGYSGHGEGKNNPALQHVGRVGPLPVGYYTIGETTNTKGPLTVILEPDPHNFMFGRSTFRMHGDSSQHPGEASEGCIIQGHGVRAEFAADKGNKLAVYAESIQDIIPQREIS